jgi:hypothetical protein
MHLTVKLRANPATYKYQCVKEDTGRCPSQAMLNAARGGGAGRRAELIARNGDIDMLRIDGVTLVDLKTEQARASQIATILTVFGGLLAIIGVAGTLVWGNFAGRVVRDLRPAPPW